MKLSNTRQRRIIVEELRMLKTHPTAEDLYNIVRNRLPNISLATVYRNLDLLAGNGEVLCLEVAGKQKRYDGNPLPHFHLRCEKCGAVEDFTPENAVKLERALNGALAGRVKSYNIEFSGICRNCTDSGVVIDKAD